MNRRKKIGKVKLPTVLINYIGTLVMHHSKNSQHTEKPAMITPGGLSSKRQFLKMHSVKNGNMS